MNGASAKDRAGFFLAGAVLGAAVALLLAPESGEKTRRRIRRKGEDAAEYLADAGKDLAERCEDLYEQSTQLVGGASQELTDKYRELSDRSKQLVDEAAAILRRATKVR